MFCLFRNSQIEPRLNRYVILLSLIGVMAWLYFSFVEKSLVGKVLSGEALIVDLVFGLPLVLMLAVVVYACIYWGCKLLIILLLPDSIIMKSDETQQLEDEMSEEEISHLEEKHGQAYWNQEEVDKDPSKTEKKSSSNDNDESK